MNEYMGLINQVRSLPELIRNQYEDLERKTRSALSTPEIFKVMRVTLTACGDSYAASLAVRDAFASLTGLAVDVTPSIELSRSYDRSFFGWAPLNPLVIAVSNSGSVARVAEAISRASTYGAFTLGVTGNRKSPLAEASNRILDLDIPSFEAAPGTRSYVVSVLALLLLAIRIGEVRGRYSMDEAMRMRLDMLSQADELERLLPSIESEMKELSIRWSDLDGYDFIGTGMEFGSAWYAHAKVLEMLGKYSSYKNSEDWLHTNLFLRNNHKTGTLVFSDNRNGAYGRTEELIGYASKLERPLLVIGDTDKDVPSIRTPKTGYFFNSALTDFTPVNILLNHIANAIGEEDGRGCKGVWKIADGAKCIRESEIKLL